VEDPRDAGASADRSWPRVAALQQRVEIIGGTRRFRAAHDVRITRRPRVTGEYHGRE
jgi:hypothetical protein